MACKTKHERYMQAALALARAAGEAGEIPVGAVVVDPSGAVIGEGHNRRITDADPTAHAEILALRQATARMGDWRLTDCWLYATLEPCPMCAGALVAARVAGLVFGCTDPKAGSVRTLYTICEDPRLNHRLEVLGGVLSEPCADLLRQFFGRLRSPRIG